jgi:tetratricopeptide (TPR) repeat protein
LLLCALEVGLRLGGYGYPTTFFLRSRIQGKPVFIENARFGWRFFSPTLARSPTPLVMPATKPPGTYRILLFGESAALGDPRPAYGFGRYLEVLLEERFPRARFEVVCVAMTAINSHGILPIARECAGQRGDLWIVYMGHNEMIGPFGVATIFGQSAPPLRFVRAVLALKATRVGQLVEALGRSLRKPMNEGVAWTGLKLFADQSVAPDDPRKQVVYENFRRNLTDIVESGIGAGAKVLLAQVACNLKDCPPFASQWGRGLNGAARERGVELLRQGAVAQVGTNYARAIDIYEEAAKVDGRHAELQYRLGQCWLALTNLEEARRHFELARDDDALPCRADSRLNAIVDEVGARFAARGVVRFDAGAALAAHGPAGIPGSESFFEHVHLTFDGNYRLARALAEQVATLLPAGFLQDSSPDWAGPELCARRLGLSDWNRYSVYESVLQRIGDAPFTNQLDHAERVRGLQAAMADLRTRLRPQALTDAETLYEGALARAPEDFRLHEAYAEFLEANGRFGEAQREWGSVRDLVPHHCVAYYHLARMLARQGKLAAANTNLAKALKLRPDFTEARVELGLNLAKQGKPERALPEYLAVLKRQPGNATVLVHLANALAALNRRSEAIGRLREAVRLRPTYWEAHYLLGVQLALDEKTQEAAGQFAEVIRLRPSHAPAHLNLALALTKLGRLDEARNEFRETLQLDPSNQKAKEYLQTLEPTTLTAPSASPGGENAVRSNRAP